MFFRVRMFHLNLPKLILPLNLVLCVTFAFTLTDLADQKVIDCNLNDTRLISSRRISFENCLTPISLSGKILEPFRDAIEVKFVNFSIISIDSNAFDGFKQLESLSVIESNLSKILFDRELPQLHLLDVHSNRIWILEPRNFATFPSLRELNLSKNRISRINNSTFYGCDRLETIDLSENDLERIDEFTFQRLRHLRKLSLRLNRIKFIDQFAFATPFALESIDLSENKLRTIEGDLFFNLLELKELRISRNEIRFIEANVFERNTALVYLDVSHNQISNLPERVFAGLERVEFLNMSHNRIASMSADTFAEMRNLKAFDASANLLSYLVKNQFGMKSLVDLHLGENIIETISTHAFDSLSQLRYVDLSNNRLSTDNFLGGLSSLNSLNLSFNRFKGINTSQLSSIENIELIGNYWQCAWLIPELVFSRLPSGMQFVPPHLRHLAYDEIDCYAGDDPQRHILRHIVVIRTNQSNCIDENNSVNTYQRAFNQLVSEEFKFKSCLFWITAGMVALILLVHLARYFANDLDRRRSRMRAECHMRLQQDIEEFFRRKNEAKSRA